MQDAEAELDAYKTWLQGIGFVNETVIDREIRRRPHMICLLGPTGSIATPDLVRWELGLGGVFQTDLAIGNHARREFVLVEFEGANERSVFGGKRTLQSRAWSS